MRLLKDHGQRSRARAPNRERTTPLCVGQGSSIPQQPLDLIFLFVHFCSPQTRTHQKSFDIRFLVTLDVGELEIAKGKAEETFGGGEVERVGSWIN